MAKQGTIVLDAGHGGTANIGGSDANHAVSVSGVTEKEITLDIALRVRDALAQKAAAEGHSIKIVMTREKDENLGLAERASLAKKHDADLLLSIHCNGFNKQTRGTETLVLPTEKGNLNIAADKAFAQRVQTAVLLSIKKHDPKAKDRQVKEQSLGVLRDVHHGPRTRACLLELEFIDVPEVDELLVSGPKATEVRADIAASIAHALIASL
ncbi:MAG TPA: N-acetylmuramoyl-L-alanine amidase [Thermoanaerobaculia bacterium]|jgi:N-acetylmuramoyl-L-alanine amidase